MRKLVMGLGLGIAGVLLAGEPIVRNGTFDETKDGKTVGWQEKGTKYFFRDGEGRSGTRAFCYSNDDPEYYGVPAQVIKVKPGKMYEIEVWVRTENLKGSESGATICMEWSDANGKWLGGSYSAEGVRGTRDWTRVRCMSQRIPDGAKTVTISPYVRKGMTGKAWFDDVMVTEFVPKPIEGIYSSAYRNLADEGEVTFKVSLNLEAAVVPDRVVKFHYVDAAGKAREVPLKFDSAEASFTLSVAELAKDEQKVRAEVCRRADGVVLGVSELDFTRVDHLPERAVWFDRLGRAIVHGKPFFPLGMYWSGITTNNIDRYVKGPFNCLMPYGSPNDVRLLDYCHSKGLKVIYSVKDIFHGTRWAPSSIKTEQDEYNYIVDRVKRFKNHPALLAWYLNDELPLTMLPRLSARRTLMEELDPGHPGWVVLYQYSQIRHYLSSFDVIGTDPYPIPSKPALMATEWTRATAQGTMGCKPLWQVPQAFNWGVYKDKEQKNRDQYRAPTENELRSMCWQCIANGANGLILYSFFDLFKPWDGESFERRWAECCHVGEEIRKFIPVMLSDEKACHPPAKGLVDAKTQGTAVSVRSWWKDGAAWVLVVNGGDQPMRAQVRLDGPFTNVKSEFGAAGAELQEAGSVIAVDLKGLGVAFLRLEK